MCLGIPGRVMDMVEGYNDQIALVDVVGAPRQINVGMLEETVKPGDWIMIHLGFAVEIVDAEEAERALTGLELLGQPRQTEATPTP
jgi:hydrogenase assembly chaperone HypC/HupF